MNSELKELFDVIDKMFANADIDYLDLKKFNIDEAFFADYSQVRIVNSFLFNFSKLQDKIGAKLFRRVLYEIKETDDFSITMIDALNLLEKLNIIEDATQWELLRETRNALAHEYPFDIQERIENIALALESYVILKQIYVHIKFMLI